MHARSAGATILWIFRRVHTQLTQNLSKVKKRMLFIYLFISLAWYCYEILTGDLHWAFRNIRDFTYLSHTRTFASLIYTCHPRITLPRVFLMKCWNFVYLFTNRKHVSSVRRFIIGYVIYYYECAYYRVHKG